MNPVRARRSNFPTKEPDAQDVARLLHGEGRKVVPIAGDLTDEAFFEHLITRANRELGGLDILVDNATHHQSKATIAEIT